MKRKATEDIYDPSQTPIPQVVAKLDLGKRHALMVTRVFDHLCDYYRGDNIEFVLKMIPRDGDEQRVRFTPTRSLMDKDTSTVDVSFATLLPAHSSYRVAIAVTGTGYIDISFPKE